MSKAPPWIPRPPLDAFSCPLGGHTLVEASAGTGKTYAITGLFLRLLLEPLPGRSAPLTVPEILVVTYTRAATEELGGRIRSGLRSALAAFREGKGEGVAGCLLAARKASGADLGHDGLVMEQALLDIDEAGIFTIHGFCEKVLRDRAFEAAGLFEARMLTDTSPVTDEVVDDFLRRRLYGAPLAFVAFAGKELSRQSLRGLARRLGRDPGLLVRPPAPAGGPDEAEGPYRVGWADASRLWAAERQEVRKLLEGDTLKQTRFKPDGADERVDQADRFFADGDGAVVPGRILELAAAELAGFVKKGKALPPLGIFGALDALAAASRRREEGYRLRLMELKREFLGWYRRETARRLRKRGERGFDDLLLDAREALGGPSGPALAASITRKFPAALIDEFQDTDPVQAEIFRTAYASPGASLFLVGDPKQSIYGFRGADVFAYLRAQEGADRTLTLDTNRRATPGLVDAVNTLFSPKDRDPFLNDRLVFEKVKSDATLKPLREKGEDDPSPLRLWFLARHGEGGKVLDKGIVRPRIHASVASGIVDLLQKGEDGELRLTLRKDGKMVERALMPCDVAVLVRKGVEGRDLQGLLLERGVKSVIRGGDGVFASAEAEELLRVLRALADPGDERLARGALATTLLGEDGDSLAGMAGDEAAWAAKLERFRERHREWANRGFTVMSRRLLREEEVRARLLSLEGGERRATNLLHLLELCEAAAAEGKGGPEALAKWLDRRISEGGDRDESELRLESDERLLTIATIHASKGREWPVVFCPYFWGEAGAPDEPPLFHDRGAAGKAVVDLGSGEQAAARDLARKEALAENLRLLYVALTRASHRCTFTWGAINQCGSSALHWLLHGRGAEGDPGFAGDDAMLTDLKALAGASGGAIGILEDLPLDSGRRFKGDGGGNASPWPGPRTLARPVAPDWSLTSFSGMARDAEQDPPPGRDEGQGAFAPPLPPEGPALPHSPGLAALPRGRGTGVAVHEVLQAVEFDPALREPAAARELARDRIRQNGLEGKAGADPDSLLAGLDHLLSLPLGPDRVVLAKVPAGERVAEMPFLFDRGAFAAADWSEPFRRHGGEALAGWARRLGDLSQKALKGLVTGSIDLVFAWEGRFHLLDWKTNDLRGDYSRPALDRAMEDDLYLLQAHLYAVALHRHLGRTVPGYDYDRHFGGILYLFLRGIVPGAPEGSGVWRARPPRALIEALDRALGRYE